MSFRPYLIPLVCALILSACAPQEADPALTRNLPWQIEILPDGHSRVFGIVPGQTSLLEAKRALDKKAEVKLFKSADGSLSLELFYGRVKLGFLDAYLITEVDASQEQLKPLLERGSNPEAQPSGAWKYDLSFPDIPTIQDLPVRSLTYIPAAVQFDAPMLEKHFGAPAERRTIDQGREYWLYPEKGLVIMLADGEKELLQYVAPSEFARLKDKISRELPRSIMD
ncbi:MAG: hypothetical protein ACOZAQ_03830 [Pseudomonadota bacterium]